VSKHQHRREVFIQGITSDGRAFRPSDWAERLAGTMSVFRPRGSPAAGLGGAISYSPYCVPRVIGSVKCVIVNEALREIEPMAWDFVMNFARDNDLQVVDACLLPDPVPAPQPRGPVNGHHAPGVPHGPRHDPHHAGAHAKSPGPALAPSHAAPHGPSHGAAHGRGHGPAKAR
jgi:hypothetical protein